MSNFMKFTVDTSTVKLLKATIDSFVSKPLGYYQSLENAINCLKAQGYGIIEIQPNDKCSQVSYIKCSKDSEDNLLLNLITYGYSQPESHRPFAIDNIINWQPGDIVINSDYYINNCLGWICVQNSNKWKQIQLSYDNTLNEHDSQSGQQSFVLEHYIKTLPVANSSQENKLILLTDNNLTDLYCCTSVDETKQSFYWLNISKFNNLYHNVEFSSCNDIWTIIKINNLAANDDFDITKIKPVNFIGKAPDDSVDSQVIMLGNNQFVIKYCDGNSVLNKDILKNSVITFKLIDSNCILTNNHEKLYERLYKELTDSISQLNTELTTVDNLIISDTTDKLNNMSTVVNNLEADLQNVIIAERINSSLLESLSNDVATVSNGYQTTSSELISLINREAKEMESVYAPLNNAKLAGIPTAPTPGLFDNSTRIATTAFVKSAVADMINTSDEIVKSLNELKDFLNNGDSETVNNVLIQLSDKLSVSGGTVKGDLTVLGDLTATASSAIADGNNNEITETYLPRSEASSIYLKITDADHKYLRVTDNIKKANSANSATVALSCSGNSATASRLFTAKTMSISDNQGLTTGPAVMFDGSSNIVIKLPNTIKATINGSATTASYLTNNKKIAIQDHSGEHISQGISFNGSKDIAVILPEEVVLNIIGNASTADKFKLQKKLIIKDYDETHSSELILSDFSNDIVLKLPKTIKADLEGSISESANSLNCSGNSATANRLLNPRSILINLQNTDAADFDGTSSILPGITGVLDVSHGGTGVMDLAKLTVGQAKCDANGNVIHNRYATVRDAELTGTPTAPTPYTNDCSNQIANTMFVNTFYTYRCAFGICYTSGNNPNKTVSIDNINFFLVTGARVSVKFMNKNDATSISLNVNNSDDVLIKYMNGEVPINLIKVGIVLDFIYDGENWNIIGNI